MAKSATTSGAPAPSRLRTLLRAILDLAARDTEAIYLTMMKPASKPKVRGSYGTILTNQAEAEILSFREHVAVHPVVQVVTGIRFHD
jgi:hypothetical protein